MSDLQLALIALAALALIALYAGEKWQDHRRLRGLRERLHGGVGDALLQAREPGEAGARFESPAPGARRAPDEGRIEPVLQAPGAGGERTDLAQSGAQAAGGEVVSEPLAMPAALLRPDWAEDPLLDCSLEIRCARAVDGVSVIDAAAGLAHADWKLPVHFVVWDGRHQQWVLPDRFGYYTDALASIQLADRRACLDEAELGRFVQAVQQLARALGADVDQPDPARLVAQARELDRLCARFDVRIGLTVESKGGSWTGPQLRSAAQECGFVAAGAQRWVLPAGDAAGAPELFVLAADPARAGRLALELDVALVPAESRAFAAMVERAHELAAALGGRVVDDNGRPIDAASAQAVERQLEQVYHDMRAAGIEPGSTRARRLYA